VGVFGVFRRMFSDQARIRPAASRRAPVPGAPSVVRLNSLNGFRFEFNALHHKYVFTKTGGGEFVAFLYEEEDLGGFGSEQVARKILIQDEDVSLGAFSFVLGKKGEIEVLSIVIEVVHGKPCSISVDEAEEKMFKIGQKYYYFVGMRDGHYSIFPSSKSGDCIEHLILRSGEGEAQYKQVFTALVENGTLTIKKLKPYYFPSVKPKAEEKVQPNDVSFAGKYGRWGRMVEKELRIANAIADPKERLLAISWLRRSLLAGLFRTRTKGIRLSKKLHNTIRKIEITEDINDLFDRALGIRLFRERTNIERLRAVFLVDALIKLDFSRPIEFQPGYSVRFSADRKQGKTKREEIELLRKNLLSFYSLPSYYREEMLRRSDELVIRSREELRGIAHFSHRRREVAMGTQVLDRATGMIVGIMAHEAGHPQEILQNDAKRQIGELARKEYAATLDKHEKGKTYREWDEREGKKILTDEEYEMLGDGEIFANTLAAFYSDNKEYFLRRPKLWSIMEEFDLTLMQRYL